MAALSAVLQTLLLCICLISNVQSRDLGSAGLRSSDIHAVARRQSQGRAPRQKTFNDVNKLLRQKKHVRAFVGVMTGYTKSGLAADVYKDRRDALRATWFPNSCRERKRWETEYGIIIRFVIGRSDNEAANLALDKEAAIHKDFFRLDNQEDYLKFSNKTRTFFRAASFAFDADWYVKMDDDIYLRPDRLRAAIDSWDDNKADYVGCINRNAPVIKTPGERWYEHSYELIGDRYWTYFKGAMYALRSHTVKTVIVNNFNTLRLLHSNEDACLGLWVLGHNMKHWNDNRLCQLQCTNTSVAVIPDYWTDITGQYMPDLHAKQVCRH